MRSAIIENATVTNVVTGQTENSVAIPAGMDVAIGWTYDGSEFLEPPAPIPPVEEVLRDRINDLKNLYEQKMLVGYIWEDCPDGPQTVKLDKITQSVLTSYALRATRSIGQAQNRVFKWKFAGNTLIELSDDQFLVMSEEVFDWTIDIKVIIRTHAETLYGIQQGSGTDDEKREAIRAYNINEGW